MIDQRVVVDMLFAAGQVQAVQHQLGAAAQQFKLHVGAGQPAAEAEIVADQPRAFRLVRKQRSQVKSGFAFGLNTVMRQLCPPGEVDFGQGITKTGVARGAVVMFDHRGLAVGTRPDQNPRVAGRVAASVLRVKQQVQRAAEFLPGRQIDDHPLSEEGAVQRRKLMRRRVGWRQQPVGQTRIVMQGVGQQADTVFGKHGLIG